MAAFTIVMATYNRPGAAVRAARCAIAQTVSDWTLLVIGDRCTDDTGDRLAALGDERIRFINLPERFGEQAGPNAVGTALAETPWVAFLNHDDLWLDTHLAEAAARLERGVELFWSRAATFVGRGPRDDTVLFREVSPEQRSLDDALDMATHYYEPMSSWAASRALLARVGRPPLASQSVLAPIAAYLRMLWAAGPVYEAGRTVTVLKDNMSLPRPIYAHPGDYAEPLVRMIETGRSSELAALIDEDAELCRALGLARGAEPARRPGVASAAEVRRRTGLEPDMLEHHKAPPLVDGLHREVAARRTGEAVAHQPDFDAILAKVKAAHA